MKRSLVVGLVLSAVMMAVAFAEPRSKEPGALSDKALAALRQSFKMDKQNRALYNAITNNDISALAINRDILLRHDELFSHKIETKGITNQKRSGRCWMFAGLNVLRPAIIKKLRTKDFEFSESYLAFWDKLEKANCFLERIIAMRDRDIMDRELELILRKPVPDGGYWEGFVNLVLKYGLVPKQVMEETNSSENTALMNNLLSRKLRADAVKLRRMARKGRSLEQLRQAKNKMLKEFYKMLVLNYGQPPTEFVWRFEDQNSVVTEPRRYTPQCFFRKVVAVDLEQYVDLFNDPSKPYGKHYRLRLSRNLMEGQDVHFVNVEIEQLKAAARKSVLDGEPVWFACDVGKDQSRQHGIMAKHLYDYDSIFRVPMRMNKAQRALFRDSVPNHAMVFVGLDMDGDKVTKWRVENSWGKDKGRNGYWSMYDSWFDANVFSVIVKKKYVPKRILRIFEQPAEVLPPWDPMFCFVQ